MPRRPPPPPVPNSTLEAALAIASYGIRVGPSCTVNQYFHCTCLSGKRCREKAKHPTERACSQPTIDPSELRHHWTPRLKSREVPDIVVFTGRASGIVILSVVAADGGRESLERLVRSDGPLPDTAIVETGDHDFDYYFKWSEDINPRPRLGSGLHLKTDCHWRMAPSPGGVGNSCTWLRGLDKGIASAPPLLLFPVAPAPPDVAALEAELATAMQAAAKAPVPGQAVVPGPAKSTAYGAAALRGECQAVEAAGKDALQQASISSVKLGGLVTGGQVSYNHAFFELLRSARKAGAQPEKLPAIIEDCLRAGMKRPRRPRG